VVCCNVVCRGVVYTYEDIFAGLISLVAADSSIYVCVNIKIYFSVSYICTLAGIINMLKWKCKKFGHFTACKLVYRSRHKSTIAVTAVK
jgi:hypothetical protein